MKGITPLATAFVMLLAVGRSGQPITCEAGHFQVGENATVTCNFHRSMADSKEHIYVVHYPFNASEQFSGNFVVQCYRRPELLCKAKDGYRLYNNTITRQLTVVIPRVKTTFAGHYVCQLVPPGNTSSTMCNLTVQDTTSKQPNYNLHTLEPQGSIFSVLDTVTLVLATSTAFLAGVVITVIIYSCHRIIRKRTAGRECRIETRGIELEARGECEGRCQPDPSSEPLFSTSENETEPECVVANPMNKGCALTQCQPSRTRSLTPSDDETLCKASTSAEVQRTSPLPQKSG